LLKGYFSIEEKKEKGMARAQREDVLASQEYYFRKKRSAVR